MAVTPGQASHVNRQDGRGIADDPGAHDGGKPVRAEVAEHVPRPFQVFQQAERAVVIRACSLTVRAGGSLSNHDSSLTADQSRHAVAG